MTLCVCSTVTSVLSDRPTVWCILVLMFPKMVQYFLLLGVKRFLQILKFDLIELALYWFTDYLSFFPYFISILVCHRDH